MRACGGLGLPGNVFLSMQRPRISPIPYSIDTSYRFAALARTPWSIFLDSGRPHSDQGRYDIFAAEPYLTMRTRGPYTEIRGRDSLEEVSEENPFQLVKRYLGAPVPSNTDLPFSSGAMGYFAYDLGRSLEQLPVVAENDIGLPEMAVGLYDWVVVVDHSERCAWLVGRGRDEQSFDEWDRILEMVQKPSGLSPYLPFRVLTPVISNLDRSSYAQAFRRIKHYIREGDCYQVNLAQRFSARVSGDPWEAYQHLRRLNPAPYSAYFNIPEGVVLSSSPERFLKVQAGQVETKPIKGTRPRSPYKARDHALADELRKSPKDRAENLMIVDLLRNDLGKTCAIGSIRVPKLFEIESFATVHHLVSTVTGRLAPGKHALDLLAGCFPGGSITGAPKLRAMEIIEELEPHRRSVYCGAIGYIGYDGSMDTNIAIRTLVLDKWRMHGWAGGGIVMDSVLEEEYQETLDKAAAMLRLLAGAEASHVGA
jgi:para-aminobenzoate synthetase component 1